MSGIALTISVDDLSAGEELRALIDRMDDLTPFLRGVSLGLINSTQRRFDAGTGPDGAAWVSLAASTIRNRVRKGQTPIKPLVASGSLKGSIVAEVDGSEVRVGPNNVGDQRAYARIHQLGGTINKPARAGKIYRMKDANGQVGRRFASKDRANHVTDVSIRAHTITIPARPYLGISQGDEAEILEQAQDWLIHR